MQQEVIIKELRELQQMADHFKSRLLTLELGISEGIPAPLAPQAKFSTKLTKNQQEKEQVTELGRIWMEHNDLRMQGTVLQQKFNLLKVPHLSPVKDFNRSGDPKVFDGYENQSKCLINT